MLRQNPKKQRTHSDPSEWSPKNREDRACVARGRKGSIFRPPGGGRSRFTTGSKSLGRVRRLATVGGARQKRPFVTLRIRAQEISMGKERERVRRGQKKNSRRAPKRRRIAERPTKETNQGLSRKILKVHAETQALKRKGTGGKRKNPKCRSSEKGRLHRATFKTSSIKGSTPPTSHEGKGKSIVSRRKS